MRGLKLKAQISETWSRSRIFYRCVDWNLFWQFMLHAYWVASFTDAWIETYQSRSPQEGSGCRIFYRCVDWNIKTLTGFYPITKSHLLQMRGLKRIPTEFSLCNEVASFTDAWIETHTNEPSFQTKQSHLLQMRGLKPNRTTSLNTEKCRIFYRCVDWNRYGYSRF